MLIIFLSVISVICIKKELKSRQSNSKYSSTNIVINFDVQQKRLKHGYVIQVQNNSKVNPGFIPFATSIIVDNNNKVISAVGLIPGEKGNPYVADNMPKGFGMEIDNILGEFNIPPVKLRSGFVNNINYMKDYIDNFVKQINPNYGIQCIASRMVDDDQLQSDEAKLFG